MPVTRACRSASAESPLKGLAFLVISYHADSGVARPLDLHPCLKCEKIAAPDIKAILSTVTPILRTPVLDAGRMTSTAEDFPVQSNFSAAGLSRPQFCPARGSALLGLFECAVGHEVGRNLRIGNHELLLRTLADAHKQYDQQNSGRLL